MTLTVNLRGWHRWVRFVADRSVVTIFVIVVIPAIVIAPVVISTIVIAAIVISTIVISSTPSAHILLTVVVPVVIALASVAQGTAIISPRLHKQTKQLQLVQMITIASRDEPLHGGNQVHTAQIAS